MTLVRYKWATPAGLLLLASLGSPAPAQIAEPIILGPVAGPTLPTPPPRTAVAAPGPINPAPRTAAAEPSPINSPPPAPPPVPVVNSPPPVEAPVSEVPVEPGGGDRVPGRWAGFKRCLQECFLGVPEAYDLPPLGASVYASATTQVANAEAAGMVLYHYDFIDGSPQLNFRGKERLHQIAALLPETSCPLIIEWNPCAASLDQARRMMVYNELTQGPFPVPLERVIVGPPIAHGLNGMDASLINRNLLLNTQNGGSQETSGGGGAGLTGGFAGGGAGGGFSGGGGGSSGGH
ncbi:MAG: hypothetical protein JO112_22940 [Planctomycetes bacterium]|nr:hypothetical protein [Planctomycetota bacterium]